MDLLEHELRNALHRAAEFGASGPVQLRNPALVDGGRSTHSTAASKRGHWWPAAVSAALTVTVIAAVLAVATRGRGHVVGGADGSPTAATTDSSSATPGVVGKAGSDGKHPLWDLVVPATPARTISGLPAGATSEVPKPYTVNPDVAPDLARYPTLVTANGPVEFKEAAHVYLIDSLPQGVLVTTTGLGHDGEDGMHDVRLLVVAEGNARREIFHGPTMLMASASPDGKTVAVNTWTEQAAAPGEIDLVDVASGSITHRLSGQFTDLAWAANNALLLIGPGDSPKSYAWSAPWSSGDSRAVELGLTSVVRSATGLIGVNESRGCLERIAPSLKVSDAICGGWSAGRLSPDGRYVNVAWSSPTGSSKRYGVLDTGTNQIVNLSLIDGGGAQWLGQGEVLVAAQADNNGGQSDAANLDSAVCTLASATCERVSTASFSHLFQRAEWLGK